MSSFYEDSDSDIDIEEEEDTGDFFAEEEEVVGNEDGDPDINIVNFLEEVSEASADEDEAGALNQNQDRSEFLSSTEIRHLTAAFTTCDKTGTGELNFQDFTKVLSVMGKKVTKREAQKYFEAMDEDKSGFISLEEWIGFYANNMQFEVDEKELLDSFIGLWQQPTALYPDASQRYEEEEFIPKEKLFEIMTRYGDMLSDEEAAEMIRECNPDEAGRIFFESYRRMLIDTTTC